MMHGDYINLRNYFSLNLLLWNLFNEQNPILKILIKQKSIELLFKLTV